MKWKQGKGNGWNNSRNSVLIDAVVFTLWRRVTAVAVFENLLDTGVEVGLDLVEGDVMGGAGVVVVASDVSATLLVLCEVTVAVALVVDVVVVVIGVVVVVTNNKTRIL